MTVRNPVVCVSCGSKIITRTQIGHKDMQKHSFPCPIESGQRDSVALKRAERDLASLGVPTTAIRTLQDRRVLTVSERGGISAIQLTHDVLLPIVRRSRDERARSRNKK